VQNALGHIIIALNLVFSTLPSFICRSFLAYFSVIYHTQALMSTRVQLFADYLNQPLGLFAEQEAPSHCENVFRAPVVVAAQ
jgi:hypothetical protein